MTSSTLLLFLQSPLFLIPLVAKCYCVFRLRYILHQLNRGELPLEDLKRNIEYAALVLETAYMDETRFNSTFPISVFSTVVASFRRICDEDDDLAEVTPETVPDEVREWLAATFTRQTATTSRQKPKFKSVANAIRTGIFFDKYTLRTFLLLFRRRLSVFAGCFARRRWRRRPFRPKLPLFLRYCWRARAPTPVVVNPSF